MAAWVLHVLRMLVKAPPETVDRRGGVVEPGLADRVNARLDEAFDRARRVVAEHEDELLALADALVQRGTLEGPEIAALTAAASPSGPSS